MSDGFTSVARKLTAAIVGLAVMSVGIMAFGLYEANLVRFGDDSSSGELHSLIEPGSDLEAYVAEQKEFEAHFVELTRLVKEQQREELTEVLLIATIPIAIVAGVFGLYVSRYALGPVKRAVQSKERFLQDAAHELRNPLAAMQIAIDNRRQKAISEAMFLTTIRRQTKRLVGINEDLLYLEREQKSESGRVDAVQLIQDLIEDMQPIITKKKIKLQLNVPDSAIVAIDTNSFIKVAKNIISNALKYTPDGGTVKIAVASGKTIEIVVTDSGIGIDKKDLERIGERFYRGSNTKNIDGTGLGLAIVYKVLDTYGGTMNITSRINKGTTVALSLKKYTQA